MINELRDLIRKEVKRAATLPPKTHLKTMDACEFLSVSPNTLTKVCAEHGINPVRLGGCLYYAIEDLNRLFQKN